MTSFIKIIMNRIKKKLLVEFRREIHSYNPIENVFQWFADYCVVLSPKFDDVINNSKITLKRKLFYYTHFAIHLSVLIKYIILVTYGDPNTAKLLGESLHYLCNIYFANHLLLWLQLTVITIIINLRYIGEQRIVKILVTISQFDCKRPFNRINNRKFKMKLWLVNKVFAIIMIPTKWLIFPFAFLYCWISVHFEEPSRYNLVTLAINSIVQFASSVNATGRLTIDMCKV